MSKYINADKLIEDLRDNASKHFNSIVNSIIIGQPSADVVEVVRCKDCKYYKTVYESYYKQLPDYYPTENDKHNGRCNHPNGGLDGLIHEDNFCSKGERKETEQ